LLTWPVGAGFWSVKVRKCNMSCTSSTVLLVCLLLG
jgi:hypothetical protein